MAEDHDSNPIKMGIGKLKERGAKVVGVNPIRTGYNAIADEWFGITPGTDGLLILSLVHELLKAGKIDLDYLARCTNAPCLVDSGEGAEQGPVAARRGRQALVIDRTTGKPAPFDQTGVRPIWGPPMTATAPCSSTWPNAICRPTMRPRPWPTHRHPRRRASGAGRRTGPRGL